jgi:hypothetical protein
MSDGLRVLRLTDYQSYTTTFQAQIALDQVFVDDLRDNDDDSLSLVPRITTFSQLKEVFKLDINYSLGRDATPDGELYWALVGFYLRTGIAAFIPQVLTETGQAAPDIFVFAHWPSAPAFPDIPNPNYHNNAVGGYTNINGDVGFGYSGDAVVGGDGGVYDIWVSADPPQGTRFFSDMAIRLGWWGGTDHLTPNPIFRVTRKGGAQPPPTGASRLVVYDNQGDEVGYTPLISGPGTGGRIALVTDGKELAYVGLE